MSENKGKPSGKYAEDKTDPGRKGDYKRSSWPEDAPTQRVQSGEGQQVGINRPPTDADVPEEGRGRNRKAGSPR
jgi:hypothetical protein